MFAAARSIALPGLVEALHHLREARRSAPLMLALDLRPRLGDLLLELAVEIRVVAAREVARRSVRLSAGVAGGPSTAAWTSPTGRSRNALRQRLHRVRRACRPVAGSVSSRRQLAAPAGGEAAGAARTVGERQQERSEAAGHELEPLSQASEGLGLRQALSKSAREQPDQSDRPATIRYQANGAKPWREM